MRRRRHHRRSHRRGSRRRNPGLAQLTQGNMAQLVGGGAIGFFGSRFIPENIPGLSQYNNGWMGYGLNALSGYLLAMGLGKFWGRSARTGALVGTGVAVISRIVVEKFSSSPAASASVAGLGDMDFNLGYYTSERFPYPQGAPGGPYSSFPGTPYGSAPMLPTSATAVTAGRAAAASLPVASGGQAGNARWPADGNWA